MLCGYFSLKPEVRARGARARRCGLVLRYQGGDVVTPRRRNSIATDNKGAKAVALFVGLLVSAFLMSVALRSQAGGLLAWFTLIPLFLAIRLLAPGRAFLGGAFWGLCLFLFCTGSPHTPVART